MVCQDPQSLEVDPVGSYRPSRPTGLNGGPWGDRHRFFPAAVLLYHTRARLPFRMGETARASRIGSGCTELTRCPPPQSFTLFGQRGRTALYFDGKPVVS